MGAAGGHWSLTTLHTELLTGLGDNRSTALQWLCSQDWGTTDQWLCSQDGEQQINGSACSQDWVTTAQDWGQQINGSAHRTEGQ